MNKSLCWLGLLAVLLTPAAHGVNKEIRARFAPDPAQPNKNVFINQTPNSGYCADYPAECRSNQMFSIQLPIRLTSKRSITVGNGARILVPANWRRLTVRNAETQREETLEVRIVGVGSRYILSDSAASLTEASNDREGHQKLWIGSSWVNAPSPCVYSGVGSYGSHSYQFFWKTPQNAHCIKRTNVTIPAMSFEYVDIAYELRTPNPLGMSNGLYTGAVNYVVGLGGDFDFGDLFVPDDSNLTLDFVLDVQHTLKVDLPPGGNKVVLEPEGGWQPWIDGGRKPARIYREQLYYLSASSSFKIKLFCDAYGIDQCYLRSAKGNSTRVNVLIGVPAGIHNPGGPPFYHLLTDQWITFEPTQYLDRTATSLLFEMPKDAIDALLVPGFSDTFSGNITVVWDSEV